MQYSTDLTFSLESVYKIVKFLRVLRPKTFLWVCHFPAERLEAPWTSEFSRVKWLLKTPWPVNGRDRPPLPTEDRQQRNPSSGSCGAGGISLPNALNTFPPSGHRLFVVSQGHREGWKSVLLFHELLGYWWLGSEGEGQKNQVYHRVTSGKKGKANVFQLFPALFSFFSNFGSFVNLGTRVFVPKASGFTWLMT